jgi:acetyl esterase/lipase
LYLHGGAYITGSCHTHRGLAGHLAKAAGLDCFLLDYRLAPEHPFPAALDDAHAAYLALHAQNPACTIVLAGDSAGGGLALALALRLRDTGHPAPGAMALLSPWTDLTLSLPKHDIGDGSAVVCRRWPLDTAWGIAPLRRAARPAAHFDSCGRT